MAADWCFACGGDGWIDEDQAHKLGLTIDNGRTEICPVCGGSGEPASAKRGFTGCLTVVACLAILWWWLAAAIFR